MPGACFAGAADWIVFRIAARWPRCVRDMTTPSPARSDYPQRPRAADRPIEPQFPEIRLASDRLVEQRGIAPSPDLDRAKAAQVLGHILRVEQFDAARNQPPHQVH